jgi:hypothetical protein
VLCILSFLLLVNSLGTLYQQIMDECNFVDMSDNFDAVYIYFMAIRHKRKLWHWIQPICKIIKLSLCIKDFPRRRIISSYQDIFYIHGSMHRDSILIRSNKMQQYAGIYLLQNHSTCFGCPSHPSSGVHKTVTAASSTDHSIWATTVHQHGQIGYVGGWLLLRYYDSYQRLQLQLYVLLMVGAMDTRNL